MGIANLVADGDSVVAVDTDRMARTVHEHRAIAEAIAAGDAALTDRLTREHIAAADRAIRGLDPA
jgi:DNA-binding GntR family transcriptional regulator